MLTLRKTIMKVKKMKNNKEILIYNLDSKNNNVISKYFIHFLLTFLIFIFIFYSYIFIKPLDEINNLTNGTSSKIYGIILISILTIIMFVLYLLKKINFKRIIIYLLLIGLVLKMVYMLYTPATVRQYDTFSTNHNGHFDYTLYIFENFKLPNKVFTESNVYQFYHPPVNYFTQAIFMHAFKVIHPVNYFIKDTESLFQTCQILSCFYCFLISLYGVKTICLTKLRNSSKMIGIVFIIFFPRLNQFSGQLNNDPLAALFTILAIYRVSKWYLKGKHTVDFLLTSLYLGLGMATKLSSSIISLGLAFVFLIELIRSIKKKENSLKLSKLLIQYVLFLIIVIPLGLSFQVYLHNVYKLPYNFVFRNLNSALFTGYRGYIENRQDIYRLSYYDEQNFGLIYTSHAYNILIRYIAPIYFDDFIQAGFPYCNAFENYNIVSYAIRSALFGEFGYWNGISFASISVVLAYLLLYFSLITLIYCLIKDKKIIDKNFILAISVTISIIIFYIYLQISMPFGCSMDFRYIVPIIIPLSYILCYINESLINRKNKLTFSLSIILKLLTYSFAFIISTFYFVAI